MKLTMFDVTFHSRKELAACLGVTSFNRQPNSKQDPLSEIRVAMMLGAKIDLKELSNRLTDKRNSYRRMKEGERHEF